MKRYEYKIVDVYNHKKAEDTMNEYAKDGWKVVSVTYWMNFKATLVVTFEREVK